MVHYDLSLVDLRSLLCSPGRYEVRLRYRVDPGWNINDPQAFEGFWKGEAVSNWVPIEILAPTGVDEVIWSGFLKQVPGRSCSDFPNWLTNASKDILASSSTSTYAGYAILHGGPWHIDPVGEVSLRGKALATAEKWPDTRAQMEKEEKDRKDLNQDRADQLAAYLKARPDFVYADFMKLELATRYAYLERYQEAQCLCEELMKRVPESEDAKLARTLLDFLKAKGLVKPRGS
jgi:hypothetical protein